MLAPGRVPSTITTSRRTPSRASTGRSSPTWWTLPIGAGGLRRSRLAAGGGAHGDSAPSGWCRGGWRRGRRGAPGPLFLDLAYARLGVDPLDKGVRLVDAESFATDAAGMRGPLLVAQCWSKSVLSGVKLATDPPPGTTVTVLHHLGLPDEAVWDLPWEELDRSFEPDHLTSLWIPELAAPVAGELARLDELVHTLRERCPWDREQTHGSLSRHLLEESYEVLEAIDGLVAVDADATASPVQVEHAVAHLEEELGDLLFQVYFHATLAAEAGRFSLADVARGVHDKLVSRHPHVFGDIVADSPDQVASNWEALKKLEKGRASVTEGIPKAMPALALAAKLQRKALTVGIDLPGPAAEAEIIVTGLDWLLHEASAEQGATGERGEAARMSDRSRSRRSRSTRKPCPPSNPRWVTSCSR